MGWSVYIHISPSNKYYVGITSKTPEERWRNGFGYYTQSYFYNAIQKYGWDNFQHEIIAENLSGEEAKKFEIKLIKILTVGVSVNAVNTRGKLLAAIYGNIIQIILNKK